MLCVYLSEFLICHIRVSLVEMLYIVQSSGSGLNSVGNRLIDNLVFGKRRAQLVFIRRAAVVL